ncbi:MAG: hypothetical protein JST73_13390, partial [Actinobacteria bacterium]|nr:hypothetical protein [Actinomycetota bacterium]
DAARRPLTQAELLLVGQYANRRDNLDVDELENLAAMYRVANDDSEVKLLVDVLKPSVAKIAQNEASERMNAARHKVEHLPWKRPTLSVQARQRLADAVASEIAAELGDLPDAAGLGHDAAVRLLADADRNAEHAWQHHRASLTNVSRGRDPLPPAA